VVAGQLSQAIAAPGAVAVVLGRIGVRGAEIGFIGDAVAVAVGGDFEHHRHLHAGARRSFAVSTMVAA